MNIAKDAQTIREELFGHIEEVQEEYIKSGWLPSRMNLNNGVIRGLLEIFIWGIYQLYQFMEYAFKQATPNTATGEWLDMHAAGVDLVRKQATQTRGYVTFYRKPGTEEDNILIKEGRILRTPADAEGIQYRFITTEEVVLQKGEDSVRVPVVSEEYGAKTNVDIGLISELVTPVNKIDRISNEEKWRTSEGADEETDSQFLERYILQWRAQAGITSAAYALAALSVPGVVSVKIFDEHYEGVQGGVGVIILGSGNEVTDNLEEMVEAAIKDTIIINDYVTVKGVDVKYVDIEVTVEYLSGDPAELEAAIKANMRAKIAAISGNIGEDLVLSRIISDVINMNGVKRVLWDSVEEYKMPEDEEDDENKNGEEGEGEDPEDITPPETPGEDRESGEETGCKCASDFSVTNEEIVVLHELTVNMVQVYEE